jgi:hypothetical protein
LIGEIHAEECSAIQLANLESTDSTAMNAVQFDNMQVENDSRLVKCKNNFLHLVHVFYWYPKTQFVNHSSNMLVIWQKPALLYVCACHQGYIQKI